MEKTVADILVEALPYIREFSGMTIVIKYGGHAMVDEDLKDAFARDITLLKLVGANPVVVHGGGPQINKVLDQMGICSTFVKGMRITDQPTMDVVEMVLGGKVNKSIVAQINQAGGRAVGLSGKDGELIKARKMTIMHKETADSPPEIIDPGLVGEVTAVNPRIINTLTREGFIPIIAPVGTGDNGETFNINADLVASHVATALKAGRLIMVTDVDGVKDQEDNLLSSLNAHAAATLIDEGVIAGGMIPKVNCALDAISWGVNKVHIINGRRRHALLLELLTDKGIGTEFKA
ncbi:acetylglutamate kinase [Desulfatibacillum aliphaticivorans]|uniref:Acetylglutamate kinase n=1 Tax=Desulfatibacillum aliphaticivorans TaxID=218208 RepID=B8FH27_DESAL|nr:acetylglutamate kinase [Desulfatibacillum aliphaticivorans]ACL02115.1 acetylglutamate kinase [Desulfatibacillum aliphaticivorans]